MSNSTIILAAPDSSSSLRLRGKLLTVARVIWIVGVLVVIGLTILAIPRYINHISDGTMRNSASWATVRILEALQVPEATTQVATVLFATLTLVVYWGGGRRWRCAAMTTRWLCCSHSSFS